jgi:hypothetical protein
VKMNNKQPKEFNESWCFENCAAGRFKGKCMSMDGCRNPERKSIIKLTNSNKKTNISKSDVTLF